MNKTICIYASSSNTIDEAYFDAARELGCRIALRGDTMLYGGGMTGLMGAVAGAVHENGGRVVGIMPEIFNVKGIVYDLCDELVITPGMRERKAAMDKRSDAFIAMPGGFGTLEELLEIITLKQLGYHDKPVVMLNVLGFYDRLAGLFEHIIAGRFATPESGKAFYTASTVTGALDHIDGYKPYKMEGKWPTDVI